ncbi:unnamed protein product [Rotaria sp. Silwood2]|nr:unnamed protein product [Rotaria sp. Silwood2]CAF3365562.1 unnamed protein product [Rotaria sp. Silwood2]CAF4492400.1 unnamed protein product [Rotaria sp. Silwood2]CAF4503326.1 unnamed protein product [Rotaria sp. Silwood2]
MGDATRIAKLLLDRVTEREEPNRRRSRASLLEEEIVRFLLEVIENIQKCTSFEVESETTLDHDDDNVFSDPEDESIDSNFDETEDVESPPTTMNCTLDYMRKVIDYYDACDSTGRKRHAWKSTKHRFKIIPHQQYIARFRHYIEQDGTKREKMRLIDDFVCDKFEEARERVLSLHDRGLKRWILQKAAEESILNFEASKHWLQVFKHRHRICSRKITKPVTRHHADDTRAINVSVDSFVADVKREMSHYKPEEILNTDQVGLELELHSTRALSHEDEHVTLARVRSKNATTHSYTIQPMIFLADQLVDPVFLCLKETKEKMSDTELTCHFSLR